MTSPTSSSRDTEMSIGVTLLDAARYGMVWRGAANLMQKRRMLVCSTQRVRVGRPSNRPLECHSSFLAAASGPNGRGRPAWRSAERK